MQLYTKCNFTFCILQIDDYRIVLNWSEIREKLKFEKRLKAHLDKPLRQQAV